MKPWRTYVSRGAVTSFIAIAGAALLIATTVVIVLYQQHAYRSQKLQEVVAQSDVLAASVTAALVFDDAKAAQDYVSALKAYPELDVAAVYDARHHLVASITRGGQDSVPTDVALAAPYVSGDRIIVASPVMQGGALVGKVYLRVQVDSFMQRLIRYSGIVLLVTMAVLMLSVLGFMQQALRRANAALQAQMAERARAEEALRQSQKMEALGQLAGGIAHDFNNLLAIIRGSLQLMQRRLGPVREDVQRFIDTAIDGVDRAANVTQRVLAFSRRQTLKPQIVDLDTLLADMLELIRQSVGGKIEITTHFEANWKILCDTNQMETVILNLAINARDAMPDGGTLAIGTSDEHLAVPADGIPGGDYVRLEIRDTGMGMSEAVRSRAFDPFFTTKPQGQGTGLGLSMTLGFVNQSNGYLQIESAPGKGTAIVILMPRAEGLSAMASTTQPASALIVEDEPALLMLVAETLRDAGFVVYEASNGQTAIDLVRGHPEIRLMITDIRMPGMNGYQVTDAALALRPKLRVMLMTGYSEEAVPKNIADAGIEVLRKPFNVDDIPVLVNRMLEQNGNGLSLH